MTSIRGFKEGWRDVLARRGFVQEKTSTKYEEERFKGEGSVVVYKSGKVLIQGNDEQIRRLRKLLLKKSPVPPPTSDTLVGTDECLKGDTFGGIVVAGVRASKTERKQLLELGVKDSKRLSHTQVNALANKLMKGFRWHAISLTPKEYNARIRKAGLTRLLNMLHEECNSKLKTKSSKHIVDKFPGCTAGDMAIVRAESSYVEVAAASVIARFLGLQQMEQLSRLAGFRLPLGSTHVRAALRRLRQAGKPLDRFAKISFRNVQAESL